MLMQKHFLKSRQNGSSLIEVLVTMIIISLGLLGQAGLIARSSKANNAAFMRSQATLLAYDILERLRLNRALAVAGSLNVNYVAIGSDPSDGITGTAIQNNELRDWKTSIEQALASGDGQVSVDGAGNVTINIRWCEVVKGVDCSTASNQTTFSTQSVL
jgi:type IV pilus assembly protein PilV